MYHVLLLLHFFLSGGWYSISLSQMKDFNDTETVFGSAPLTGSLGFLLHSWFFTMQVIQKVCGEEKKGKENSHNHIGFCKFQSFNIFSALGCVWMDLATELTWEKCLWLTLLTISLYDDKKLHYVKDSVIFLISNYHIEKLKVYFFANLVMPAVYSFVFTCKMCLLLCSFSSIRM